MKSPETDLLQLIRQRFADTRPPQDFRPGRVSADLPEDLLPRPAWKPAAVLVPVVARPDGPTILLTRRTERLQDHAGQVSFPGGSRAAQDPDPVQTALRETEEETGVERRFVEVVGFLNGYLTITGYAVTPVVGLVVPGFRLRPDPLEVAQVFEVPLAFLQDPGNRQVRQREWAGRNVDYYAYEYCGQTIWGATAAMLVNFVSRLDEPSGP